MKKMDKVAIAILVEQGLLDSKLAQAISNKLENKSVVTYTDIEQAAKKIQEENKKV